MSQHLSHLDIIKHTQKKSPLINRYLGNRIFYRISNINKFLKILKKSYEISIIFVTVLKIVNLFSFNQYLFSDRTKLNLNKGLSGSDNPFSILFSSCTTGLTYYSNTFSIDRAFSDPACAHTNPRTEYPFVPNPELQSRP